jgi:hypothetical protein
MLRDLFKIPVFDEFWREQKPFGNQRHAVVAGLETRLLHDERAGERSQQRHLFSWLTILRRVVIWGGPDRIKDFGSAGKKTRAGLSSGPVGDKV